MKQSILVVTAGIIVSVVTILGIKNVCTKVIGVDNNANAHSKSSFKVKDAELIKLLDYNEVFTSVNEKELEVKDIVVYDLED